MEPTWSVELTFSIALDTIESITDGNGRAVQATGSGNQYYSACTETNMTWEFCSQLELYSMLLVGCYSVEYQIGSDQGMFQLKITRDLYSILVI